MKRKYVVWVTPDEGLLLIQPQNITVRQTTCEHLIQPNWCATAVNKLVVNAAVLMWVETISNCLWIWKSINHDFSIYFVSQASTNAHLLKYLCLMWPLQCCLNNRESSMGSRSWTPTIKAASTFKDTWLGMVQRLFRIFWYHVNATCRVRDTVDLQNNLKDFNNGHMCINSLM